MSHISFYMQRCTTKQFTSPLSSSPPAKASNCSSVNSSAASIPAIFCTISFNINKSKLEYKNCKKNRENF